MFSWAVGGGTCRAESRLPCRSAAPEDGSTPVPEATFLFATNHHDGDLRLCLDLRPAAAAPLMSPPSLRETLHGSPIEVDGAGAPAGLYRYHLVVPPASPGSEDDELIFRLQGEEDQGVPSCRIVLRRTSCAISTALVDRRARTGLEPQTRAALLWYSWRRYQELVALNRFTHGLSGSDVLVFRPRLRDPDLGDPLRGEVACRGIVARGWGSCLLVKTGEVAKIRQEWERFHLFLADRLHPFMARSEAYLTILDPGTIPEAAPTPRATIIGSFLGGDLMHAEPLESVVRGTAGVAQCEAILERLFSLMAVWYDGAAEGTLGDWTKVFRYEGDRLLLFGKYDLLRRATLAEYEEALYWDINVVKREHIQDHLLGPDPSRRQGLLHRLMDLPARYSLVHGDFHPRNVLAEGENVWLLDFGETGVGPTLFDFAKLEIYLRLWCLDLRPAGRDLPEAASQFERHLLDVMLGSEGSLEPVRWLAPTLGADPEALVKVAACIVRTRQRALAYSIGGPDRRDYLAVLFLALIQAVRYAGMNPAWSRNYDLLMALFWLLEDVLSRIVGLEPFERLGGPLDYRLLISRHWLAAPRAPARVAYLMDREDGRRALPALAATRGVLQNLTHHLDVFDHTLLVLAGLEEVLRDPLAALLDPATFLERVDRSLAEQGLRIAPLHGDCPVTARPDVSAVESSLDRIRDRLARRLDADTRLLLKWVALLHDVGKPATRRSDQSSDREPLKVRFLGHEVYALHALAEHLDRLFPEAEPRQRFRDLVRRHHLHHHLVERYLQGDHLERLETALAQGAYRDREIGYLLEVMDADPGSPGDNFALLILHGFADLAACRGPEAGCNLDRVAEIDLALLGLWARRPHVKCRRAAAESFQKLGGAATDGLGLEGASRGSVRKRLEAWFLERACPADEEGPPSVPTLEEVRAQAAAIRRELGL